MPSHFVDDHHAVKTYTKAVGIGGIAVRIKLIQKTKVPVALDKNFGLKIPDPAAAKEILQSVNTIVAAVHKKLSESAVS